MGDVENDVYQQMENYNFDKPITTSLTIEDCDEDEENVVRNSQLPKKPVHYVAEHKDHNSSTVAVMTTASAHNVNSENMGNSFSVEQEKQNAIGDYVGNSCAGSNLMPNSHFSNHKCFTFEEKTQYTALLDTVSENLIMITKYFHYYLLKSAKDQYAWKKFCDYKYHFYNQSYSAVVSVFLPQKHNRDFIRTFIDRTIELAGRKSWYPCMTISSLEALVNDIIQWTKIRKTRLEADENRLQHLLSKSHPVLPSPPALPPVSLQPFSSVTNVKSGQPSSAPPPPPYSNITYFNSGQPSSAPPGTLYSNVTNVNSGQQRSAPPPPYSNVTNAKSGHQINAPPPSSVHNVNLRHQIDGNLLPNSMFNDNRQCPMVGKQLTPAVPPNRVTNYNTRPISSPPISSLPSLPPVSSAPPNFNIFQTYSDAVNTRKPTRTQPPEQSSTFVPPVSSASNSVTDLNIGAMRLPTPVPVPPESAASTNLLTNQGTYAGTCNDTICIFSHGPPGNAISINIDAKTATAVDGMRSSKKCRKDLSHPKSRKRKIPDELDNLETLVPSTTIYQSTQNSQWSQNIHHSSNQPSSNSRCNDIRTTTQPVTNSNAIWPDTRQNDKEYYNNDSQVPLLSRSVSRDSGFISPVLTSLLTANDNTTTVYPHCTDTQELLPEITHVTSMNPNAVFIENGICKVCGSVTNNKCMTCYKVYYCSPVCQTLDWPSHQRVCKTM